MRRKYWRKSQPRMHFEGSRFESGKGQSHLELRSFRALSITNSRSSLKLMSIESVKPSSHLILCRPLLLLPPIPPSTTARLEGWG